MTGCFCMVLASGTLCSEHESWWRVSKLGSGKCKAPPGDVTFCRLLRMIANRLKTQRVQGAG